MLQATNPARKLHQSNVGTHRRKTTWPAGRWLCFYLCGAARKHDKGQHRKNKSDETSTHLFPPKASVFQICRHVVTCDDRQAVLTTTIIILTTGSFCWACDFLNFENRSIIEGDMAKNVQVGKYIFSTNVLEIFRLMLGMEHCLLNL